MDVKEQDTIVAQATPIGKGGVGIVRVSGPLAGFIAEKILRCFLTVRLATYTKFYARDGHVLDQGIALLFKAPYSFTGEDVLELQGHGGPVIMDLLIKEALQYGARLAEPGEFSQRAFLNDKIDLSQAEAIADLIDSHSEQAAKLAMASLQGEFSREIHQLIESLVQLRIYVEAAIDFPEEEIDFLNDGKILNDLNTITEQIETVKLAARQGNILREGMKVVIAGKPNAGKSSLLNALAGRESAIVTDIPGTTRDVLKEHIQIDGMPLHIIDTAGLRDSQDQVEKIGIQRAWQEIQQADRILLVVDSTDIQQELFDIFPKEWKIKSQELPPITLIRNKADLSKETIEIKQGEEVSISLSAKKDKGIELLRQHLKQAMGYQQSTEGSFMARRRHLNAIERSLGYLAEGKHQLLNYQAGELLADELRQAQNALSEITGEFQADDLLGRIFSSFCIGK